jgi:hypothetical protein
MKKEMDCPEDQTHEGRKVIILENHEFWYAVMICAVCGAEIRAIGEVEVNRLERAGISVSKEPTAYRNI